jgi:hypothetical protein
MSAAGRRRIMAVQRARGASVRAGKAEAADSDTITITILQPVPSAPSSLTASARNGTVTLKWKDNSTNETNFLVERKSGTTWSQIQTLGPNLTTTRDTPGTGTFSYRVSASNSAGTSAPSNVVTVTVR